ncbi:MAG: hypothetical protein JST05_00970 [Acidobacteria bacterium]|nr:hypothetical protein [Acidobacteriota bacterium]
MFLPPPPALIQAQPSIPSTVEARPGVFIVQGAPTEATFASLKAAGITAVFNLRTDAEGDFRFEEAGSRAAGAAYDHCPVDHAFSASALDLFRAKLNALPEGARILVHCASGNRAAAALLTAWVLDQHMPEPEAIALARKSGLTNPRLEAEALAYIRQRSAEAAPRP